MVDTDTEVRTLYRLKSYCEEALAKYPTTLQDDLDLLSKDDTDKFLSFNERNCVLFR